MANKNFERQLAALEQIRQAAASPAADDLRKPLQDRNNYIVAKAAQVAAHFGLSVLVPDLIAALDRFFVNPVKSDPQCWAKHALVQALADLGHDDPAVFIRGLRHIQMEPVWGGQEDSAGRLRAACALALVPCRGLSDFEVLGHLVETLVDRDKTVRIEGARAIGRVARPEAALLLRLRALLSDEEPEVLGACFSGVLSIEGLKGMDFVSRFLDGGDSAAEAALALGMMRDPQAFQALKRTFENQRDASFASVLLSAMALTRLPEATEFLIQLVERDAAGAPAAVEALGTAGITPELRARIAAAVKSSGSARLRAAYEKRFG
jgi:HEAT repeat protein